MNKSLRPLLAVTVVLIAVVGFAVERFVALRALENQKKLLQAELDGAAKLYSEYPAMFGTSGMRPAKSLPLKMLAQQVAKDRKVEIGSLSESQRQADRGVQEHLVHLRLTRVPHANLARLLGDIETLDPGARAKELHVRPSRETTGVYEEAEVVLARLVPAEEVRKP